VPFGADREEAWLVRVLILIDGEVVAAPVVRSAVGDSAVISGDFSRSEAERIAEGIGIR
jgi:preprotein translocase subunit SecD